MIYSLESSGLMVSCTVFTVKGYKHFRGL